MLRRQKPSIPFVVLVQHMETRMRGLKKVMLAATLAGGIGLTGAGAAQAYGADGGDAPDVTTDNAQFQQCEQEFTSSLITVSAPVSVLGDSVTNIGNFCTQAASE